MALLNKFNLRVDRTEGGYPLFVITQSNFMIYFDIIDLKTIFDDCLIKIGDVVSGDYDRYFIDDGKLVLEQYKNKELTDIFSIGVSEKAIKSLVKCLKKVSTENEAL